MSIIRKSEAPVFRLPGLTVVGLASPKRGAAETCVWQIRVDARTPGVPHRLTREEVFVATAGTAIASVDGEEQRLHPGDALIVPRDKPFALANPSDEPFEATVAFPVGGQAITDNGPFTPPWAE